MSTIAEWMPSVLLFGGAFFAASLVSGIVYWAARLSSPEMHCAKITSCIFICFLLVVFFGSSRGRVLIPVAFIVFAVSGLQAAVE